MANARPPARRVNYRNDAISIHRILTAIEMDSRISKADREALHAHLTPAISLLMNWVAPIDDNGNGNGQAA